MKGKKPTKDEIKKALGTFVDAVVENTLQRQDLEEEAFVSYELCLRGAIHKNSGLFKKRFVEGYFVLAGDS